MKKACNRMPFLFYSLLTTDYSVLTTLYSVLFQPLACDL